MKQKILITGASGMLGSDLVEVLKDEFQVIPLNHHDLDISDSHQVIKILELEHPSILINAAAYTKVDLCETNFDQARRINGEAVGILARACEERKIKLVHFSTDYVFDGKKKNPYVEEDLTHPLNAYGRSKLEGEKQILTCIKDFLLIRTSWLFGLKGPNFVDKIVERAHEYGLDSQKELKVVTDQIGSPTYSLDLAKALCFLIKGGIRGVFHITNSGVCSWYEFAVQILKRAGLGNVPVKPVQSEEFPSPTQRPSYSVLSNAKLEGEGYFMRLWQVGLEAYLSQESK
ncbi:MAG: dTDP-4-dehydrorhamnose reductase [Chlamydiae bacterium]|nr:dTDP-4-dehydrorhamnose reductase [Chlamydiota bacterium]MBI3277310.1 dTDP-4-dehydrorhamnose reductase [Chlamydiota bacterium]